MNDIFLESAKGRKITINRSLIGIIPNVKNISKRQYIKMKKASKIARLKRGYARTLYVYTPYRKNEVRTPIVVTEIDADVLQKSEKN